MKDLVRGEYFPAICDIRLGEPIPTQPHVTMYADTDQAESALDTVKRHHQTTFTLVTHNSDHSANETIVPSNLRMWYTQNLNFSHERVKPIPIGLENMHWHPHKQEILDNKPTFEERIMKPFAQFNMGTYRTERMPLVKNVMAGDIDAGLYYCLNGTDYELYIENLRKYAFCLCPRGNGIDTHRIWEALYMKCIPIVKSHVAHKFELELPILFINDWLDITPSLLNATYSKITTSPSLFNTPLLSMRYWQQKINP